MLLETIFVKKTRKMIIAQILRFNADADVALRLCQHRSDGYLYVPATVPLNPQYPL